QGVVLAADPAELGERLRHRGRGIAVRDRDDFGFERTDFGFETVGRKNRAPFHFDAAHLAATTPRDFDLEVTEAAEDRDEHALTRLDERGERGLDAGARGAVDKERPAVFRLQYAAIELR